MLVILLDMDDAIQRFANGEQAYEYKTEDPKLRLLGPACGFGTDSLRIYREQGLYAENLAEARDMAGAKKLTVTGVWFVKNPKP